MVACCTYSTDVIHHPCWVSPNIFPTTFCRKTTTYWLYPAFAPRDGVQAKIPDVVSTPPDGRCAFSRGVRFRLQSPDTAPGGCCCMYNYTRYVAYANSHLYATTRHTTPFELVECLYRPHDKSPRRRLHLCRVQGSKLLSASLLCADTSVGRVLRHAAAGNTRLRDTSPSKSCGKHASAHTHSSKTIKDARSGRRLS